MKIQFDSNLEYQVRAINSIVEIEINPFHPLSGEYIKEI